MITTDNPEVAARFNRVRAAAISARAETALGRLGGQTATRRPGRGGSGRDWLTAGLSAAELDRDTAAIRNLLSIWKRNRRARPDRGTSVTLPSGRRFKFTPGQGISRP
jgi:hypothetical protein